MSATELLAAERVAICLGTGGVGKTTLAAALGLSAALHGRPATVLTIDPARQLARALGLSHLPPTPTLVPAGHFTPAGLALKAPLHAAMLAAEPAWDAFVRRHAPHPEAAETLLANPFYRRLTRSFAGALEYATMDALVSLCASAPPDELIVVDTPPSSHAVAFLQAPRRIDALFAQPIARWARRLLGPASGEADPRRRGPRLAQRLREATGARALADVAHFFESLEPLVGAVRRRSAELEALFGHPRTAVLLVTSAVEAQPEERGQLVAALEQAGGRLQALIVNRAHPLPHAGPTPEARARVEDLLGSLAASCDAPDGLTWLRSTYEDAWQRAKAEARSWQEASEALPPGLARIVVPELDRDVHAPHELALLVSCLSGPSNA